MHVLMETFTKSQFGYCPLAWMICVGKANSRINHLHKQALRIVHKNKDLSFDELLKKKKKKWFFCDTPQVLSIRLFKVKNGLTSKIINNIFEKRQIVSSNLRSLIFSNFARTSHYALNSLRYFAASVWDIVAEEIKNLKDLDEFNEKNKRLGTK